MRVKLRAYGERMNLLARDSELALAPLFEYIAHVAIKQHRILTRDDFRVQFEDATRINVPVSRYNQMQAALTAGLQPTSPATTEVNYSVEEITSIPDLPVPCALRTAFVDILAASISEHGFVAIQGSTGKGKSTLAWIPTPPPGAKKFSRNFYFCPYFPAFRTSIFILILHMYT